MEEILRMKNDSEMEKFPRNKACLILPLFTNYGTINNYVFIPNVGKAKIVNDTTVKNEELESNEKNLLLSFQFKKDLLVVYENYTEITDTWALKKKSLELKYPNCSINLFLIIQSRRIEDGKIITTFPQNNEDILIVFTHELNNTYFFEF